MFSRPASVVARIGAGFGLLLLGACADGSPRAYERTPSIAPEWGQSVRQDIAAQIADPDAHYKGTPAPGADGQRAALAERRYVRNSVIKPASTATSTAVVGGSSGGSGSGGDAGGSGAGTGGPESE